MPSRLVKRYRHFGWRSCLNFFFLLCRPWRWRQHAPPKLQYVGINATSYLRISLSTAVGASNSLRINVFLWRATTQFIRNNCQLWILYKVPVFCTIKGEIEVTGRRGRRRRKLLDDLKERRGYSHLKEEALDRTMWRARFGRQTTKWISEFCSLTVSG